MPSWIDKLVMTERSRDKWRIRANDRLLAIRDLENKVQQLERANAALVVEAQTWLSKYKQILSEISMIAKQKMSLCEVIKKTRGFGES
ncbi:hypothetical protein KAR91_04620 [Candidatus Pacearchaeota archaeon]|nr:hypothetical protein [Candidatus Pacearchaeota archaeon]